ncbi:MAG: aminoacyl-tRNA hydrolase [Armatimonadetes bacterium]|nr:aminoacyl-tRNA hydrolase [Armatimonadota bacterium]
MKLIACLGNPGPSYQNTRHNAGFLVADALGARHGIDLGRRRLRAIYGRGSIKGTDTIIAKPQTYMNDSGDSVRRIAQFFKIEHADLIVVYDDIALDLGIIRLRRGGSDAGHKGIRSIVSHLGTSEIQRVRLGIGLPPAGISARDWVLSDFRPTERKTVEDMVERACEALECWVSEGIERAMNIYNG